MSKGNGFVTLLKDDELSLALFLRKMAEFDSRFCEAMVKKSDFTIRLEVRGDKGNLLHVRVYTDDIEKLNDGRIKEEV